MLLKRGDIRDAGVVRREVTHHGAELSNRSTVLASLTDGELAATGIVTGSSGTGRTCVRKLLAG